MKRAARLLLVEDERTLARGIAVALHASGFAVDVVGRGADALRLARSGSFDAGILDLGLPDCDGIDLLRDMRREGISFPVIILTARDALDDRILGLDAGADDYLTKPFALGELEARLRALLRRNEDNLPWRQIGRMKIAMDGGGVFVDGAPVDLTPRELAVLEALARRAGRIVAKEHLFAAVFPDDSDSNANAIEVHVSRLRRKIEPAGATIRALRGIGYRLEEKRDA
ncbi:MAG: response regulator [Rhodocyclaceae bacterium]|nr:response regulator [Rhodocyclaceae bacterium]